MARTFDKSQSENIVRSAGIVSVAVFTSRVTGLVREMVMAKLFGAGAIFDAFRLGFTIPNLTRDLFAEGALSSAFVPVFSEYLSKKSKEEAAILANLVTTAIVLIVGTICVLGMIFAPQIVLLAAPGFAEVPGKLELTVRMTRIMFPFLLLVALAAQAMGILNSCRRFGVPAMASTFFNIGSVGFGLLLGYTLGERFGITPIEGMAYGVVLGGALQFAWQLPSLARLGFRFRPRLNWSHPGLVQILTLMGPAILGSAATQINIMVNTRFASQLSDLNGPVSWLGYAFRFMQLPLGLFGVAIASATLPAISRSAAAGDTAEFRETLSRSLGLVFLLTIPSAAGLVVLGESIVSAIYEYGLFTAEDTRQTAIALSCYALGLAGYAATKVLAPAFYALKDSRTPMYVSLFSILINYATASLMVRSTDLGHAGLALSTSAVALFGSLTLFLLMRHRIGGMYGRALRDSVWRISLAAAAMAAVVFAASRWIRDAMGEGKLERFLELGICIPAGLLVLYAVCRWLRVPELELAVRSLAGPLQRRIPGLRAKL